MPKGDKLTDKQEMFCREYLIDLNATQAAIRAGYSKKSADVIGIENLGKPSIQNRLSELNKERLRKVEIDAQWVLEQAVDIHKECRTNEKYDVSNALKALDTIGKHVSVGAFKEKVEMDANINHNIEDSDIARQIIFQLTKAKKK